MLKNQICVFTPVVTVIIFFYNDLQYDMKQKSTGYQSFWKAINMSCQNVSRPSKSNIFARSEFTLIKLCAEIAKKNL